jgi:hypothetical protein
VRFAWFRPTFASSAPVDDLGRVRAELASVHAIDVIDETRAHDFVWTHARAPYDLCIFELDDTSAHHYVWPYLLHYPGVLALRTSTLHGSRTTALMHRHRQPDFEAEMTFSEGPRRMAIPWHVTRGRWPLLRVPILASRMVVVGDHAWADALQQSHPDARIRYAPIGVAGPRLAVVPTDPPVSEVGPFPLRVAVVDGQSMDVVDRAIARARAAGALVERISVPAPTGTGAAVLASSVYSDAGASRDADVLVALGRPALGVSIASALAGMAASLPVIVSDTDRTAAWPSLDPQSWQPRGYDTVTPPAAIAIDPRDEEHSLMLALRRLATDAALRHALGVNGHAWWAAHHTLALAVTAWTSLLHEATTAAPPSHPLDWPAHLTDDGTGLARQVLGEFGLTIDL